MDSEVTRAVVSFLVLVAWLVIPMALASITLDVIQRRHRQREAYLRHRRNTIRQSARIPVE